VRPRRPESDRNATGEMAQFPMMKPPPPSPAPLPDPVTPSRSSRRWTSGTTWQTGATGSSPVDFRLIAATNVDLQRIVDEGSFREDLFFRLDVFPIVVPPLRERTDDIPLLTEHFRRRFAEELDVEPPTIGPEIVGRMMEYEWPGNVRELENFVERSVIMHTGDPSVPFDLPRRRRSNPASKILERACAAAWSLDRLEREYILAVLDRVRWQKGTAADILGVNRRTVHRKLKRYREEDTLPGVDGPAEART